MLENNFTSQEEEDQWFGTIQFEDEEDQWLAGIEFQEETIQFEDEEDQWLAGIEFQEETRSQDVDEWLANVTFTADMRQEDAEMRPNDAEMRQNAAEARQAGWLYANVCDIEPEIATVPVPEVVVVGRRQECENYLSDDWLHFAEELRLDAEDAEVEEAQQDHQYTESDLEDFLNLGPEFYMSYVAEEESQHNSPSMLSTTSGEESIWSVDSVPDQMNNYAYPEDYNVDLDDVPCTVAGHHLDDTIMLTSKDEEVVTDVIDLVTQIPIKVVEVIDLVTQPVEIDLVTPTVEKMAPYANRKKKFVESSDDNDDDADDDEDTPPAPPVLPAPPIERNTQFFDDFDDVIRQIQHQEIRERVIDTLAQSTSKGTVKRKATKEKKKKVGPKEKKVKKEPKERKLKVKKPKLKKKEKKVVNVVNKLQLPPPDSDSDFV